jgi:hypothetical protein
MLTFNYFLKSKERYVKKSRITIFLDYVLTNFAPTFKNKKYILRNFILKHSNFQPIKVLLAHGLMNCTPFKKIIKNWKKKIMTKNVKLIMAFWAHGLLNV